MILFAEEGPVGDVSPASQRAPWKVLIVDDERQVHDVTRLALRGLQPEGRPLELIDAFSAAEAAEIIANTPDLALILLDVVMESDDAGLQLARRIREEMGNRLVRIVLRTGQPGRAPERDVVQLYDINDYRAKDELTAQHLSTTVTTALRSYDQVLALDRNRRDLQRVLDAAATLFGERSMDKFAQGVVAKLKELLGEGAEVTLSVAVQAEGAETQTVAEATEPRVLATTDANLRPGPLPSSVSADMRLRILQTLVQRRSADGPGWVTEFFAASRGMACVIHVARPVAPDGAPVERLSGIVELFLRTVAVGFDNVLLFEELMQDRTHDRATGLLNRNGFVAVIEAQLAELAAGRIDACAVATIDLRRFRDINQELGVGWGDRLLVATGERLAASAGGPEVCARIGGDQFAVLLPAVGGIEVARGRLRAIAAALGSPILLAGREIHPMPVPGLAWCGTAGPHAEEMLARAEDAMQQAKRTFGRIAEVMVGGVEPPGRLGLTIELNAAVKQSQFELFYQPIVSASDRKVVAFEALVRWMHPVRGIVAPAAFIPTAEETGLIVPIGSWALREAAKQTAEWQRALGQNLWVSINISAAQLSEPGFLDNIKQVIKESGVDPTLLKLEVTESTIISDPEHAAGILVGLRDLGIRLCMDDFGTGYSNLGYLQTLQFDFLKIDRAFVKPMLERFESRTILRTMLALAQQLDIEVVAEGVESQSQADELSALGCDFLQGFLFGKPMPAKLAGALIGI